MRSYIVQERGVNAEIPASFSILWSDREKTPHRFNGIRELEIRRQNFRSGMSRVKLMHGVSRWGISAVYHHGLELPTYDVLPVRIRDRNNFQRLSETQKGPLPARQGVARDIGTFLSCLRGVLGRSSTVGDRSSLFLNFTKAIIHRSQLLLHRGFLLAGDASVPSGGPEGQEGSAEKTPLNRERSALELSSFVLLLLGISLLCKSIKAISDVTKSLSGIEYFIFGCGGASLSGAVFLFLFSFFQ